MNNESKTKNRNDSKIYSNNILFKLQLNLYFISFNSLL